MNETKEIHSLIDDLTQAQSHLTKKERLRQYTKSIYPKPLDFIQEIDGTKYIVRTFFDRDASESVHEKVKRILSKKVTLYRIKTLKSRKGCGILKLLQIPNHFRLWKGEHE